MTNRLLGALRRLGGAGRWSELTAAASRRELATAVAAGSVRRICAGVYALPDAPAAAVAAATHNGVVTCVSAADIAGLVVLNRPAVPHIGVPRDRGWAPSEERAGHPAIRHRGTLVRRDDAATVSLPEALARVLLCCREADALVMIDSALHDHRTTVGAIRSALPERAPSSAVLALRRADGRAASATETLARLALRRAGFRVEVGCPVSGVGWVDLIVEGCVVVELDGFAYHSGRSQFAEDRRRDRELTAQGFTVLRFTYHDVVARPEMVVEAVREALRARRHVR